jgi:hypothetical protein
VEYPEENSVAKLYKDYHTEIGLRDFMNAATIDYFVYGNAFSSPYFPFVRFLICKKCGFEVNIELVKFKVEADYKLSMACKVCKQQTPVKFSDRYVRTANKLRWIRWNPRDIQLSYNKISGDTLYYLKVPDDVAQGLRAGSVTYWKSTPAEIIDAVKNNKLFTFNPRYINHMAAPAPVGFARGWGYPVLTQALSEILHIAVLKRANEAIAWEHIVPKLVVSPAPSGAAGDPMRHISLARWRAEFERNKDKWSKDPNFVMFAPFPVNVQTLGGDGRALMVSAEIEQAERNLAMALGIPLEFAAGTLAWQTSSMSLRLLQNQMQHMVFRIEKLLQWMIDTTSSFLNWPGFEAKLAPFQLVDDETRKQALHIFNSGGKVSDDTLLKAYSLDFEQEQERLKEEAVQKTKFTMETQAAIQKEQTSLQASSQFEAAGGGGGGGGGEGGNSYDPNQLMQQASQYAQQISQQPPAQRETTLSQLRSQDYVLYAVTKDMIDRLTQAHSTEKQLTTEQGAQQGSMASKGTGVPQKPNTPQTIAKAQVLKTPNKLT